MAGVNDISSASSWSLVDMHTSNYCISGVLHLLWWSFTLCISDLFLELLKMTKDHS
jgi:hypothetical protein